MKFKVSLEVEMEIEAESEEDALTQVIEDYFKQGHYLDNIKVEALV